MAHSETPTDDGNAEELTPDYTTGTWIVPVDADLSSRAESARMEHMVVVPDFDEYGYATGTYEVTSESGSTYNVERTGGECPDEMFNSPENGCKHYQRCSLLRENEPTFPAEDEEVHPYMEEVVLERLADFAEERERLREQKATAEADPEADADPEAFAEAIAEVETFMETLATAYDRYYEATDGHAPEREIEV